MIKAIKTSELIGPALDWAVAKAEGLDVWAGNTVDQSRYEETLVEMAVYLSADGEAYSPSTDWAQGGPIIERERISIRQWTNVPIVRAYMPVDSAEWSSDGTSPLIAAMRCYVASKLGDEVDVPEELT